MSILLDEFEFGYNGITLKMKSSEDTRIEIPTTLDEIFVDVLMPYDCRLKSFNYLTNAKFYNYIKEDILTDEIGKEISHSINEYAPFTLYDSKGSFITIHGNTRTEITEQQPILNSAHELIQNQMVLYSTMPLNLYRIFQTMLFIIPVEKGNFDKFTNEVKDYLKKCKGTTAKKALDNLNKKKMEFTDADQIELFTELEIVVFTTEDNEVEESKIPFALLNRMRAAKHKELSYTMLSVVRIINKIKKGYFSLILPIQYNYTN